MVIATASSLGEIANERYRELFEGLGIGRVTGLRPEERSGGRGSRDAPPP